MEAGVFRDIYVYRCLIMALVDNYSIIRKFTQKSLRQAVAYMDIQTMKNQIETQLELIRIIASFSFYDANIYGLERRKEIRRAFQIIAFYSKAMVSKIFYQIQTRKTKQRIEAMRDSSDLAVENVYLSSGEYRILRKQLESLICTIIHLLDYLLVSFFLIPKYILLKLPEEIVQDLVMRAIELDRYLANYKPPFPVLLYEYQCPKVKEKNFWFFWEMIKNEWLQNRRLLTWTYISD